MRYNFYVKVFRDGRKIPLMWIDDPYSELYALSQGHLSKSEGVLNEIIETKKVINEEKEVHYFGGSDWCILEVKEKETIVRNGFDEFEPFEVPTSDIIKLMEEWYEFLKLYESGGIPGLIPDITFS